MSDQCIDSEILYYVIIIPPSFQVFFVMRKKDNQISLLHLYHHSLTPMETWICVKFIAGKSIIKLYDNVIITNFFFICGVKLGLQEYLVGALNILIKALLFSCIRRPKVKSVFHYLFICTVIIDKYASPLYKKFNNSKN